MKENNVLPVVKHFPGNNADDPHLGLPVIDFDFERTKEILLFPFDNIENKEEIGVLVAHSVVPALFNKTEEPIPSCLSKTVVSNVLKNQLGYKGLIFSDDLLMAALQNNGYESVESISMAIKAGINVLMIAQKEYIPFINEIVKLCQSDIELVNQIEISEYLNVSRATYSNYENGYSEPPAEIIIKFCDILKITMGNLL